MVAHSTKEYCSPVTRDILLLMRGPLGFQHLERETIHLLARGKSCLISATVLLTNCFHSLSLLLIQYRTFVESVQQRVQLTMRHCSRVDLTIEISLAKINAAKSSNPGVVCFFRGATRVFDAISWT